MNRTVQIISGVIKIYKCRMQSISVKIQKQAKIYSLTLKATMYRAKLKNGLIGWPTYA